MMLKKYAKMPDTKVLLLLCYYFFFGGASVLTVSVGVDSRTEFISQLTSYFICESTGVTPGEACERTFDRVDLDILRLATFTLMGFYPTVNLIYAVNAEELRKKWLRFRGRGSTRTSRNVPLSRKATATNLPDV